MENSSIAIQTSPQMSGTILRLERQFLDWNKNFKEADLIAGPWNNIHWTPDLDYESCQPSDVGKM